MKIAIIGAGASGLVASIKLKEKYPKDEVFLYERMDSVGKKIKATGNGKCNIGNVNTPYQKYTNHDYVEKILCNYHQEAFLLELGIPTKTMNGDGLYPISESAANVVKVLERKARLLGVNIVLSTRLIDYQIDKGKIKLQFDKYQTSVDRLIIAVGGKSNPNLGSDGCLFEVLAKHGYEVTELRPGLCPVRVDEDVKLLFGQRFHTIASLFINGQFVHEEYGEVMFKKDGLSGIVIMNLSSLINRQRIKEAKIYLAVLNKDQAIITVKDLFQMSQSNLNPLLSFVNEEIANYIYKRAEITPDHYFSYEECQELAEIAAAISFTYRGSYDYEYSQVTIGGVSVDNLNDDLSSKHEEHVYFLGEIIDVDGPCGGYNLKWAIGSAAKCVEYFK